MNPTDPTFAAIRVGAEPSDSPGAQACLQAYFAELAARFPTGFDPASGGYQGGRATADGKVGRYTGAGDAPADHNGSQTSLFRGNEGGCFLVARLGGQAVGCGELKPLGPALGEIKRMWVAPGARGRGLARRLLADLEERARRAGMSRLRLDTNRALAEARALYLKAGYREIPRYNDNPYADFWFEKEL